MDASGQGYECINTSCVSQSVIHQVLNTSDSVFKRKKFNGKIKFR